MLKVQPVSIIPRSRLQSSFRRFFCVTPEEPSPLHQSLGMPISKRIKPFSSLHQRTAYNLCPADQTVSQCALSSTVRLQSPSINWLAARRLLRNLPTILLTTHIWILAGRTKTLPSQGADVSKFKIAVFSCSNLPQGYFHGYNHAANRNDLDLALHVGECSQPFILLQKRSTFR